MSLYLKFKKEINQQYYFNKYKKEYDKFPFLNDDLRKIIILEKLKTILNLATERIPFYKGIDVDFNNFSVEELHKFPIITKKDFRDNIEQFVIKEYKTKGYLSSTSGSSGKPFKFYIPFKSEAIENIVSYRAWGMGHDYAYKPNDPILILRTYSPKPGEPLFKVLKNKNSWYLSPFDINKKNLDLYLKIIHQSKAKIIRGYGSSIYILTLLLKENKIVIPQIKSIVTSSETLIPYQRKIIEEFWNIPVLDWYGQNERVITVQQCWAGNYHNNDDYGYIEIIDNQIVATSLINNVMPFIRYNTEDVAITLDKKIDKCECGRTLSIPFKGVLGRSDDILIKKDGTKVPTANFSTAMKEYSLLKQFKIIQQKNGDLDLHLAFENDVQQTYIEKIKCEVTQRLGDLPIHVKIVDEIERDRKTGKLKVTECFYK